MMMESTFPLRSNIAGIILAAGGASRMGLPKLMLPWHGQPLIRHTAQVAIESGLDPIIVVTGSNAFEITTALSECEVRLVHNPDWNNGQSTSVKQGINSLPEQTRAVVFLLGDQPFVSVDLLQALVTRYLETSPKILAPFVNGKRSNPVIFDRSVFALFQQLEGDKGARGLFEQYPPASLPWPDERILLDIDTPEDYQNLQNK
jgi:molybdenum cofactor cytidylyltransferase